MLHLLFGNVTKRVLSKYNSVTESFLHTQYIERKPKGNDITLQNLTISKKECPLTFTLYHVIFILFVERGNRKNSFRQRQFMNATKDRLLPCRHLRRNRIGAKGFIHDIFENTTSTLFKVIWLCNGCIWLYNGYIWLCNWFIWLYNGYIWLCNGYIWLCNEYMLSC